MDVFMRSVGFTRESFFENINRIKRELVEAPDKKVVFDCGALGLFVEFYKMYGDRIGILARGTIAGDDSVNIDSCEAFALCETDFSVNKYIVEFAENQPLIVFEDVGTGNELVFALQNRIDYLKDEKKFINHGRSVTYSRDMGIIKRLVNYAAFSVYGSVILHVHKADDNFSSYDNIYVESEALCSCNEVDEFGTFGRDDRQSFDIDIHERLLEEDILSVVEGFFLPMEETETDYSVLGEIEAVDELVNSLTAEEVIRLSLNITGTKMQLLINRLDLMGHPQPGMRFLGTCRLRGGVII